MRTPRSKSSRRGCSSNAVAAAFPAVGWLLTLLACLAAPHLRAEDRIVISEVMFHPASEDVRDEWIEIYNAGTNQVPLQGWRFARGVQFTFPNLVIAPNACLAICADTNRFGGQYPGVSNRVGNWVGTLSNTRERIELVNAAGESIDEVSFADEGDWAQRQRGPLDGSYRGWVWSQPADGLGSTLELINRSLPNDYGHNWSSSLLAGGTPGRTNSVQQTNTAPLIVQVQHFPLIPNSSAPISLTARILDETASNLSVTAYYRLDGGSPLFNTASMFDDGQHGDGASGDGLYGVSLGPYANNSLVEFYVSAADAGGRVRTWPSAARLENGSFGQHANAAFQVDDTVDGATSPLYKLILTATNYSDLSGIFNNSPNSDAQVNGTLITIDGTGMECHYLVGVRNRGHGSRGGTPHNYRINFRSDNPWKGVVAINLNARTPHAQHFGAVLAQKSGVAGADARAVRLKVNNGTGPGGAPSGGHYSANEVLNSDWADAHFPLDGGGNIYRAIRDISPFEFNYRGQNPVAYQNTYFKGNNESENDYSDLIGMLRIMGTNDLFNAANVRQVVNVEQWLTHLAVMNLFGNNETGLNTGYNDDYFMYRGVNDPRFILLYYDQDTILGQGSSRSATEANIFTATMSNGAGQALDRFMRFPEFAPVYYRIMQHLLDTTFSAAEFDALIDQTLGSYVGTGTINNMKSWMNQRRTTVQGVLNSANFTGDAPTATVRNEPRSPTPLRYASLLVAGTGVTHYKYRLNNNFYSSEFTVTQAIQLGGIASGSTNTVYVIGRNADGVWQSTSNATASRVWIVDTNWPGVRLNEVLAQNVSAVLHAGSFPDLVELYNEASAPIELSGFQLTDDPAVPDKFTFPSNTTLLPDSYLVLYADSAATPGTHLGFSLDQAGESLSLYDRNGRLVDRVVFGRQLSDLSLGRIGNSDWQLTQPSFGGTNILQSVGSPDALRVNEWLAISEISGADDFVELHNLDALPVPLGNLAFTDEPIGWPRRSIIQPLSFIGGHGFTVFAAAGEDSGGSLNFSLSSEQGEIALQDETGRNIDCVAYGPQRPGVSVGRCPDGSPRTVSLEPPTSGSPNNCFTPAEPPSIPLFGYDYSWRYDESGATPATTWTDPSYFDGSWQVGPGLLGRVRNGGSFPQPIRTVLNPANGKITFYFRTRFTTTNALLSSVRFFHLIDDGFVLYLNGQEIYRFNMAAGSVNSSTLANTNVTDPVEVGPITVSGLALAAGQHLLAAEVHQSGTTSPDIGLGLRMEGLEPTDAGAVLINELLAENSSGLNAEGRTPDALELYNSSSNAVDISLWSLSDDPTNRLKWIFPAGTFLPGKSYLALSCDPDRPASTNNTGFGLDANGDALYLFSEDGQLRDSVTFGPQVSDFSIGRIPNGTTNWQLNITTIGDANLVAPLGDSKAVRVNEWMSSPLTGDDWFELYNPSDHPVVIGRFFLTDDVFSDRLKHRLPPLSFLGAITNAWKRFVADDDVAAGSHHVGFKLSAGGEDIALSSDTGVLIDSITFAEQLAGTSSGRFPDGAPEVIDFLLTSSPGEGNHLSLAEAVVSEVLTHTDAPLEDAIELQNVTAIPLSVGGWWLSDSKSQPRKFQIPPNVTLPPYGFAVFYEGDFNNNDIAATPFSLNSARGDEVYLSATGAGGSLNGYRALVSFGAAENGVSLGRYRTSVGVDFVALSTRSFGADQPLSVEAFRLGLGSSNAYPKVGPIVISEIMYRPPPLGTNDNVRDEYVQLRNLSGSTVPLFDVNWPSNTWRLRDAVDFNFPPGSAIPAHGSIVLVSFDPANNSIARAGFEAVYGSNAVMIGPYTGKLDNGGERIALYKPDSPQTGDDEGFVPYVLVEQVAYGDSSPWPASADGQGHSLQRVHLNNYGNDPANWVAAQPSPLPAGPSDTDGDGMPDTWEADYEFNPDNAADASLDTDADGLTNVQEYRSGTDPRDPDSYLHVESITQSESGVVIRFHALAGFSYGVLGSEQLTGSPWQLIAVVPGAEASHVATLTMPSGGPHRFYRIVTPAP